MSGNWSKYVIWFPGWFPCRNQPLNGDFVLRHAEATSHYIPIVIINVIKDKKILRKEKEIINNGNLRIINIYYPLHSKINVLEKLYSFFVYLWLSYLETSSIIHEIGKPKCIHVHVFQKSTIAGILISKIWKVPLIHSEHNSTFLTNAENSYQKISFVQKKMIGFLLNRASILTTVSQTLAIGLKYFIQSEKIKIIPNVVNTQIFKPVELEKSSATFNLIHISTLTANKNIDSIMEAFYIVNKTFPNKFRLTIIGPKDKHPLSQDVRCLDEMPQAELANEINKAHALILFSSFETFGCVAIEAMSCGKPVILSDIPISHEIIQEGKHGLIAESENSKALAEKIVELKKNYSFIKPNELVNYINEKYSYSTVGKMFYDLYAQLTTP